VTLLAVHVADSTETDVHLEWTTVGISPDSFTILLDGETMEEEVFAQECHISKEGLEPGTHTVTVMANGVGTRYELSLFHEDEVLEELIPVEVKKAFYVK